MAVVPHKERFTIYTFQEDESGTATVQALCEYMQEAAGNHAAELGVSIERLHAEGVAWVLARMRISPERLPSVHDVIEIETWPVGVEGLQFRRDFIVRSDRGEVLARAVSHWVVVSLASRKVGRIPRFIAEVALDNTATAMDDAKHRLPQAGPEHEACAFRARLADMDRNRHVNNVRYMDWILESVPNGIRDEKCLADIELMFRAESCRDDTVSARTMPDMGGDSSAGADESAFCHSLVRSGDDRELVRARTLWRKGM